MRALSLACAWTLVGSLLGLGGCSGETAAVTTAVAPDGGRDAGDDVAGDQGVDGVADSGAESDDGVPLEDSAPAPDTFVADSWADSTAPDTATADTAPTDSGAADVTEPSPELIVFPMAGDTFTEYVGGGAFLAAPPDHTATGKRTLTKVHAFDRVRSELTFDTSMLTCSIQVQIQVTGAAGGGTISVVDLSPGDTAKVADTKLAAGSAVPHQPVTVTARRGDSGACGAIVLRPSVLRVYPATP